MSEEREKADTSPSQVWGRPIYVALSERSTDAIDLPSLWRSLISGRWIVVATVALFAAVGIAYALLATPIYRAEVVLTPAVDDRLGAAQKLGGLASLAGLNLGGGRDATEAIAMLQSRGFVEEFIRDKHLMPVLFSDEWDPVNRRWRSSDPEQQPDMRDGVRVFLKKIRDVSEDSRTGLVTLAINWTHPNEAAEWAMELVARLNARMRKRDMEESERKLAYLNEQLKSATLVEMRAAIARVIEDQLKSMMVAQAQSEYAFRVIDSAVVPKDRSWPKRTLIVIVATVLGGFLGVFISLMRAGRQPV